MRIKVGKGSATHTMSVLADYDDESEPQRVPLEFVYRDQNGTHYLRVRVDGHRLGSAVMGGRLRAFGVVDGNFDARFDDEERDPIYLDLNGDGMLQAAGENAPERIRIGKPFRVGAEGWVVEEVSPSGARIAFRRTSEVPRMQLRAWPKGFHPTPGAERNASTGTLKELAERFEQERGEPFATRQKTIAALGNLDDEQAFDLLWEVSESEKETSSGVRYSELRALGSPKWLESRGEKLASLATRATKETAMGLTEALYLMGHPDKRRGLPGIVEI